MLFHYSTVVPIIMTNNMIAQTKEATKCHLCGKEKGSGKMFRCRGCKIASYCCRAHAKSDWKTHKAMCREMQAKPDSRQLQRSQSLVKDFGQSMAVYMEKTFKPSDMPETGEIYRATKQGNSFYRNWLIDWLLIDLKFNYLAPIRDYWLVRKFNHRLWFILTLVRFFPALIQNLIRHFYISTSFLWASS